MVTLDTSKYGYRTEELDAAYFQQSDTRFTWCQLTWDPIFNQMMKEKMNCVASIEFSENGKYPVDRLKANLMALSVVGCGYGDRWSHDKNSTPIRENDSMAWLCKVVKEELNLPLLIKVCLHYA